jgi:hypothetical protein
MVCKLTQRINMIIVTKTCADCENIFNTENGRPYKYEPTIWLCDDCHDQRMEEEE